MAKYTLKINHTYQVSKPHT